MSFVIVARDALAAAAADLAQIGSAVNAGNLAAANPTTAVAAAAADEVSAALAALFGAHAREYQAAAAQAAAYHEQFVHRLSAAATSYAVTEVTIATSLRGALGSAPASVSDGFQAFVYGPIHATGQQWINSPVGEALAPIVNAPTNVLLGRDLIGNGVTGTAAAPNGGPGGLLFGDGIDVAGRLVIPKRIRERLGLRGNDQVEITERDGRIEIEPAPTGVELVREGSVLVARPERPLPPLTDEIVRETLDRTRR